MLVVQVMRLRQRNTNPFTRGCPKISAGREPQARFSLAAFLLLLLLGRAQIYGVAIYEL